MRLLLDENAPKSWLHLLNRLGHDAEHVIDRGMRGSSDQVVFEHALENGFAVLTRNKFKQGTDRLAALTAMTNGLRIIRVTVRTLDRQQFALEQHISEIEDAFGADPSLRRVTIMNNFRLRYESERDIRRKLEGSR